MSHSDANRGAEAELAQVKDLLLGVLNEQGVLSRVKAELRATVFNAIEERRQQQLEGSESADEVGASSCRQVWAASD